MTFDAWLTVAVVGLTVALLIATRVGPDIIMVSGVTVLLTGGVISAEDALAGLASPAMATVGILFVVVAGLRETGAVSWLTSGLLGRPKSLRTAQLRLMMPVAGMSAFLNNTPVVAMLIPGVVEWSRKINQPLSRLLIPLSYAAILGGTCSLIGTSTNLVVNDLVNAAMPGAGGLRLLELAWIGLPCAVVGIIYVVLISPLLLRIRRPPISPNDDPREYTIEMVVPSQSPLVGKTIEAAGLRQLPDMFLAEIDREGTVIPAVGPTEILREGDQLVFVGVVDSIVSLHKIRGLEPATDQVFKLDAPRADRCLIETVVSNSCPIIGKSIRDGKFRTRYNAAVIAVARNGERIRRKIGDIVLRPGDTLLLEAHSQFLTEQRNSRDFYLISRIEDSTRPRHERASIAIAILAVMVLAVTTGWLSMLNAAMLAAGLMLLTRCCSGQVARDSVDWTVLIVIAASIGMGNAINSSGVADLFANRMVDLAGGNPWLALIAIYLVTTVFTELITNNAAAVLVFPIAMAAAMKLDANPIPFAVAIMIAASASFSTPIGYQTNLMVYGPGGYKYSDYLRFGIPLNLLIAATTILAAPLIWPFGN